MSLMHGANLKGILSLFGKELHGVCQHKFLDTMCTVSKL